MAGKTFFLEMVLGKRVPSMEAIEDFTDRYPWCAIGHKSLFNALCAQGNEAYLSYASKASAYIFNRKELYLQAHSPRPAAPLFPESIQVEEFTIEEKPKKPIVKEPELIQDPIKRMVMAGGDYFAPSDFDVALLEEKNPIDKFIKTNPKLTPVKLFHEEQEDKVSLISVGEDNFMTETLAKIYADQSLYQLAIEAYQKLILLYPKKSDYFVARIDEIKHKMNR